MTKNIQKIILSLWAIIGVPAVFGVYVNWSYKFSLSRGKLPINTLPSWLWFGVFGICLATGLLAIQRLKFERKLIRIMLSVGYLVIFIVLLIVISLYVSCINGDCI